MEAFGQSLGGWLARKGKAAEYEISEAGYRTYQPETSPSPDGGIFISVRIDHRRGFMASDDHASLELSFAADGTLVSAQSSLALQGRTISSELIKGGASASTSVAAPQIDRAVKIGTDLVADLSSKLLREKIVEPGRVSFPAAIRHNYNLLYQAVRMKAETPTPGPVTSASPASIPTAAPHPQAAPSTPAAAPTPPPTPAPSIPPAEPKPATETKAPTAATHPLNAIEAAKKKEIPLPEIKPYNPSGAPTTPLPDKKSGLIEYGDVVLKLARDAAKDRAK